MSNAAQDTPPSNPIGLMGIDFVQFAAKAQDELSELFETLGFTPSARSQGRT